LLGKKRHLLRGKSAYKNREKKPLTPWGKRKKGNLNRHGSKGGETDAKKKERESPSRNGKKRHAYNRPSVFAREARGRKSKKGRRGKEFSPKGRKDGPSRMKCHQKEKKKE